MSKTTRTCSIEGCGRASRAKGMCDAHYRQQRKGKEPGLFRFQISTEERFWPKVNKEAPGGCWEWTASTDIGGYGHFRIAGRMLPAHRVSWEFIYGPIPSDKMIDHRCANRACVNPKHLRVVTRSQNGQHRMGPQLNTTTGIRGVSWDKRANAWMAYASVNGRQYWGGYHPTLEAADAAARALRAQLHTHDDYDQWVKTQAASAENAEAD